jgi:hypothetical protein
MKSLINPGAKLASLGLAKGLVRAAAVACIVVTWGVGSIEPSVLGFLGVSGLAVTAATPAQARCLLQGTIHDEIAETMTAWKRNEQAASGTCYQTINTSLV